MEQTMKIQKICSALTEIGPCLGGNSVVLFLTNKEKSLDVTIGTLDKKSRFIHFNKKDALKTKRPLFIGQCDGKFGVLDYSGGKNEFLILPYLDTALSNQLAMFLHQELNITNDGMVNHSLLVGFANYLLRLYLEHQKLGRISKIGVTPFQLQRIKAHIKENMDETIGIGTLAKICNLSLHHFMRMFKRTTGETPHQFVNRLKMEYARELLKDTDQTIIQVGMEVGMNNPSHFSQLFKTHYGVSPLKYRKASQERFITA